MLTISSFFMDMFTLPTSVQPAASQDVPIVLEESTDDVERMLRRLYVARYSLHNCSPPTLASLHSAVKLHDKYDIELGRIESYEALHQALVGDPWGALAYASQVNDVELGRQAILRLRSDRDETDSDDIWYTMSKAKIKPSWQVAFATLVTGTHYSGYLASGADVADIKMCKDEHSTRFITFHYGCGISLEEIAERFDPS